MNELTIQVDSKAGKISLNYEDIKSSIKDSLEQYRGIQFTEDSKTDAKKEVAKLRKEQKELKSRVSDVKASYMKPFDEFKVKADELIKLYDEPITYINGQVDELEEKRKAVKKDLICKLYAELASEVTEFIPLDRMYDARWLNATVKEKDIRADISSMVDSTVQAINTIRMMNSEAVDSAIELYKQNMSLADSIEYINHYEKQKAEILAREQERKSQEEELRRQQEEERIREDARQKLLQEQQQAAETERKIQEAKEAAQSEVIESLSPADTGEELPELYEYRIAVTNDGKNKLEMYMDSVGIEWEMI